MTVQHIMSFEFASVQTENLCGATEDEFKSALVALLGLGNIHVLRKEATSPAGHSGYSLSVTFNSLMGDVPMLTVDPFAN